MMLKLENLPEQERKFIFQVAELAIQNNVPPREAIRMFGTVVRYLVEFDAQRHHKDMTDDKFDELTNQAFGLLAEGFGALATVNTVSYPAGAAH